MSGIESDAGSARAADEDAGVVIAIAIVGEAGAALNGFAFVQREAAYFDLI